MIFLVSCSEFKHEDGRYIYEDDAYVIHADADCKKLKQGKDQNGHDIYAKHPVDTAEFVGENFRVCAICVNDEQYEHLQAISHNNRVAKSTEARKWLYDKYVNDNYDMGSFDDFLYNLKSPDKRVKLYYHAHSKGWDVGSSFEEFDRIIGYGLPKFDN